MWIAINDIWRSATFRLALFFALAISAAISLVLALIFWQVIQRDTIHQNRVLVDEVAKVVNRPQAQLARELNLRLTRDLRGLDFAALFDPRAS